MPSNTDFPSPTRTSPGSAWQPCSAWQNWWPSACSLTTLYQQTCFWLLFSTGHYIAIKSNTWCQYNAKCMFSHQPLSASSRGEPKLSWSFLALLPETDAARKCCSWAMAVTQVMEWRKTGHSLMSVFDLRSWHVTNAFQHVKGKVKQVLP